MSVVSIFPCLSCGACCAYYRVSFYWSEADPSVGGRVPEAMTERLDPYKLVMKGTNCPQPRCTALSGEIGALVQCSIYPVRSSVCREFPEADTEEERLQLCNRARAAHNLLPLQPPQPLSPEPGPDFSDQPRAA